MSGNTEIIIVWRKNNFLDTSIIIRCLAMVHFSSVFREGVFIAKYFLCWNNQYYSELLLEIEFLTTVKKPNSKLISNSLPGTRIIEGKNPPYFNLCKSKGWDLKSTNPSGWKFFNSIQSRLTNTDYQINLHGLTLQ